MRRLKPEYSNGQLLMMGSITAIVIWNQRSLQLNTHSCIKSNTKCKNHQMIMWSNAQISTDCGLICDLVLNKIKMKIYVLN